VEYIILDAPPYPYFVVAGNATYRKGDRHRKRSGIGYFDMILVETGTLFMEVMGQAYDVSRGGVLVIPPECSHSGCNACDETTRFHWLHFYTDSAFKTSDMPTVPRRATTSTLTVNNHDILISFVLPIFQMLDSQRTKDILALVTMLESVTINKFDQIFSTIENPNSTLQQQSYFHRLLALLVVSSDTSSVNNIAFCAMQYITLHYGEKISLEDLASIANCHPTHVIRCMKQKYGLTPAKAIQNTRLQRACVLLRTTEMNVGDIAEIVGFMTPTYFCKVFRKHYGVTPLHYRQLEASL
jgi:AraC-like DNA-binding protein